MAVRAGDRVPPQPDASTHARTTVSTVRVRYAETDKMGVVYHSNYLIWFEIGRTDWLRETGWTYRSMEEEGVQLPVIDGAFYHYAYCLAPRTRSLSLAAKRVLTLVEQILEGPAQAIDNAFCAPHFDRDGVGY